MSWIGSDPTAHSLAVMRANSLYGRNFRVTLPFPHRAVIDLTKINLTTFIYAYYIHTCIFCEFEGPVIAWMIGRLIQSDWADFESSDDGAARLSTRCWPRT